MPYLIRRAAHALFLLLLVSTLSFGLLQLAPGDYFESLRLNPRVSQETIQVLRSSAGETRPLAVRYAGWMLSIAHGNWGYSLAYQVPADRLLWPRARNTLLLTLPGTLAAWILALALGSIPAVLNRAWIDWLLRVALAMALAIPDVLLALLFLLYASRTGSLPLGGMTSSENAFPVLDGGHNSVAAHLALPLFCFVLTSVPVLLAHVRSATGEVLRLPFIRAAVSYGISPFRLFRRHVLRAAANSLLSLMGLSLGGLLSSSLIVEVVFSWPGIGRLLLDSVLQHDIYLVADIAILSSVLLLAGNFLADILLYFADPRIKAA